MLQSPGITTGEPSYPGAEGPSGCKGVLAWAGLEAVTASSVTWAEPEPGLTVATLLACSVCGRQEGENKGDGITLGLPVGGAVFQTVSVLFLTLSLYKPRTTSDILFSSTGSPCVLTTQPGSGGKLVAARSNLGGETLISVSGNGL